jgi:hypothetical protein
MIPPESPRSVEAVSARVIQMDPPGRSLVYRIVDEPESISGQATGDPLIKISLGLVSNNSELAETDGVEKNPHNPPPA